MTQFTVLCANEAEAELADLWLNAKDRQAVTAAQFKIEKELARNPHKAGFEVSEGLWQIHLPPLKVFYEINDQDRVVRITGIGRTA